MAENWETLARTIGFPSEKQMLQSFYIDEGLGIIEIGKKLNAGPATIANRLAKYGIPKRKAGGPNNYQRQTVKLYRLDQRYVFGTPEKEIAKVVSISHSLVYKYRRTVSGRRKDNIA